MKTIKISEEAHKELTKLKVEINAKTLSEAIFFLIDYKKNVIIVHNEQK